MNEIHTIYPNLKKLYGPYQRKDNRKVVVLKFTDNSQTTKQYARVLLELKLGRVLTDSETVDHIDMDFTNDSVENLQVLTRELNSSKSAIKRKEQTVECVWCGTEFNLTKDQVNKRAKGLAGPFCSKTCIGHYGQQVQTSGAVLTERQQENTEYYV